MLQQLIWDGNALTLYPLNKIDIKADWHRSDYAGYKVLTTKSDTTNESGICTRVIIHPVNPIACYDFVVRILPIHNGDGTYDHATNLTSFLAAYSGQLDNSFIAVVNALIASNTYYQG